MVALLLRPHHRSLYSGPPCGRPASPPIGRTPGARRHVASLPPSLPTPLGIALRASCASDARWLNPEQYLSLATPKIKKDTLTGALTFHKIGIVRASRCIRDALIPRIVGIARCASCASDARWSNQNGFSPTLSANGKAPRSGLCQFDGGGSSHRRVCLCCLLLPTG